MTAAALARIHRRAMSIPPAWTVETIEAFMSGPGGFAVTTYHGFALGRVIVDEAELLTLAVDPDYRRGGEGAKLLESFEHEAAKRGARRAFLEVAETNSAARALYSVAGWSETGRRSGYYRAGAGAKLDAVLMEKPLEAPSG